MKNRKGTKYRIRKIKVNPAIGLVKQGCELGFMHGFHVYSLDDDLIDCKLYFPKDRLTNAGIAIAKASNLYYEGAMEDGEEYYYCYGDAITEAFREAKIPFVIFYSDVNDCNYDELPECEAVDFGALLLEEVR